MPRIAANLTMLFTEYPFLERFDRAAQAGFHAVEFQFPYEHDAHAIRDRLDGNNLELVLYNLPAGDWAAGDRGIAADASRQQEFRAGVARALEYAAVLHPPRINLLAGKSEETPENDLALLQNTRFASEELDAEDILLTIEPVNSHDVPGFAVPTTRAATDLIEELDQPNIGLQLDVYHSLRMGEDPFAIVRDLGQTIAHIQIADVPGRHQPGTGAVDFRRLFRVIDDSGYDGWVSLEYIPEGPTEEGFGLLRELGLLA
ncbi:MAG TPA: TIM barrel protein [Thermomicrobiales bacterium]|nr:TIM barrel protein [Thermomicrobiales bacterium]